MQTGSETTTINDNSGIISQSSPIGEVSGGAAGDSGAMLDLTQTESGVTSDAHSTIPDLLIEMNSGIQDSINALSGNISDAIAATAHGVVFERFVFAMIVAIVGTLSAYFFNYLHWRHVKKKENMSSTGDNLIELIEKLELLATEYWICNPVAKNAEKDGLKEIQIRTILRLMPKYVNTFCRSVNQKKIEDKRGLLLEFHSEVYDLITGDGFESLSRTASKHKASIISRVCSEAKVLVSSETTTL